MMNLAFSASPHGEEMEEFKSFPTVEFCVPADKNAINAKCRLLAKSIVAIAEIYKRENECPELDIDVHLNQCTSNETFTINIAGNSERVESEIEKSIYYLIVCHLLSLDEVIKAEQEFRKTSFEDYMIEREVTQVAN